MEDQTRIRERLETSKQRARVFREWGYFVAVVVLIAFGVYGLHTWSESSKVGGAVSAKLNGILDKLDAKLDVVQTDRLNTIADSVNDRLDDLGKSQVELNRLLVSVRNQSERVTSAAVTRINQLGENLSSLKSVTDETRTAVASLTTSTTALMDRYGLTADEAAKAIALASEKTGRSIDELNRQIANPRWGEAADNLVATTGNANKLVLETTATITDVHTDLHGAMIELPSIARDVKKTTGEISRFARVSIVVSIISRLASALIPGLLN